ncbi:MAG: cytochrome c3 family protein [Planctomycetaceae bacterium]|uniref:cytochrome c3 family protein n=1 Tax=Gimesia sp. TaxID=2024833 RepID=UPI001E094447|nr:cytochrome c3 family protein [Planctomycetaceae bacterium]MCA9020221.1 cytochrome c3 family protein [Planctomycetaceae bacterium]
MDRFLFPKWANTVVPVLGALGAIGALYVVGMVAFGASPDTTDVGYQPEQPLPFSHKLHAGKLKLDCRYCHNTVEVAGHAAIPPTKTCLNCHSGADANGIVNTVSIHSTSSKLAPIRESQATGKSMQWRRVHDLPDYVYFNHSAHVRRGVSCVSCHGRVDKMDVVTQVKPLSMGWCLECHRHPEPNLRPPEFVTKLDWKPEGDPQEVGEQVRKELNLNPSSNCSTCHR